VNSSLHDQYQTDRGKLREHAEGYSQTTGKFRRAQKHCEGRAQADTLRAALRVSEVAPAAGDKDCRNQKPQQQQFVTPVAGILASLGGVGIVLSWLPPPTSSLLVARPMILLVVTIAIAIVFLGPGAFSLDARLFGRREIIIPRAQRSPKS